MVKKNKSNKLKKQTERGIKIKNSLYLISPFCFNENHSFIYNIKIYKDFYKFSNSFNQYKPKNEEMLFLNNNIKNIENSFNKCYDINKTNEITEYFKKLNPYIIKIKEKFTKETLYIKKIMENRDKGHNITITKIQSILADKFKIKISKSTIYRILKNKLKYKFRKTMAKNIDLNNIEYKIMSFIFIKIIIKAMMDNYNFIFIDESNFLLVNNHYRTWINEKESLHFGPKKKGKTNIIMAVSVNRIINYKFIDENINKNNFELFMKETISLLNQEEIKKTIWIMDNLSVHLCSNIKEIMKQNRLKVLFTVPYESVFNPIELGFRYIKNLIYKKIYLNITELKNDVINIIKEKKIKQTLFKNFIETLKKYILFIEENINLDLDKNQIVDNYK